ncbi:Signal transduction histidine kinase [Lutibacter oricola]|uniref:histidine kinase n=1 Tax=Lutibacter oricola TaxID=762486 RepID=A0A1H2RL53_9FLAO|nr:tetratricopeptide repeat protein [Lutibacter oricola]SDW19494.1 Signal transduction histidine kinase [Lutibacter oricola]
MNSQKKIGTYGCFICFLVFFSALFAQADVNELQKTLNYKKHDTIKIKQLINAGDDCYYSFPDSSYIKYNKALDIAKKIKNKKFEAKCLLSIGYYLDEKERYKESLEYYLQALELYRSIGDEQGLANCYNYLGYSFSYLNSVEKASEYFLKALQIFKKINDQNGIADVNNGFGNLYYDIENYEEAYKYYLKSYTIYKKNNDKAGLIATYINLGNAISTDGNIEEGLKYYSKSLELSKEIGDKEGIAINYTNIGDCYIVNENYEKAEEYLNKALDVAIKISYNSLKPLIYSNYANTKLKEKKFDSVLIYVNKSFEASEGLSGMYFEYDNHDYLSKAHEALGDYDNALKNYRLFKKHTDSIFNAKKFEQIAKLGVINKLELQEEKIKSMTKSNEIRNLQSKNQQTLIYILLIFSIFFIALTYYLSKQRAERKKAYNLLLIEKEKAEESDRLKSAFLANMSHEIRTPMNAIMGFSSFLKNPELGSEKRDHFVDIINVSGERLMAIINDIVDISKIESNQLKTDITEFNVKSALSGIIEIQKNSNKLLLKKNIDLKLVSPISYDGFFIKTDLNRFTQIFDNLINNATKFTNEGSIEIGYHLKHYHEKAYIEFYVKDTGCGIPKDKFDVIFDRFSQAGEDDFKEGNGLGLSICKGLVTILNGEIWLESEENVGTTFHFTLPY